MKKLIPRRTFRIDPGYTFQQNLLTPEFDDRNILVSKLPGRKELEAIFVGKVVEHSPDARGRALMGKNVWLDCEGAHVIYVMGKRRSGKTYTLGVIVEGLASGDWIKQGDKKQAILLIDSMSVFITMPHSVVDTYGTDNSQIQEIKKWGLENEEFNIILFYPKGTSPPPEGLSKEITIRPCDLTAEDWGCLFEVDTYSDPMGQLISEVYEKVVIEGYINNNGATIVANSDYSIDDLLSCIDNCPEIEARYQSQTINALRNRWTAIKRLPVFSSIGINVKEIFTPGVISILLLRDLDQNLRSLLVGILTKNIMKLRSVSDKYERLSSVQLSRYESLKEKEPKKAQEALEKYNKYLAEIEKGLPRGWILIDEAHNYIPARGIVPSSRPLRKYVNEGRNLGLSIIVATQNPSALDTAIRRNADVLIIHSISMKDDIIAAEGMLNTFVPDSFEFGRERVTSRVFEQLIRSLPLGYAVVSNDRANRIFITKIRPRLTVHGVEY